MKAKNSVDQQIRVPGYVVEVESAGGMAIETGEWSDPGYRLPDDYVLVTFHDDDGNECYLFMPEDSEVSR